MSPNGENWLHGWKEIAAYLKCDARTAQRWRNLGLPVHQIPGKVRGRVIAYTDELAKWVESSRGPVQYEATELGEPNTSGSNTARDDKALKPSFLPGATAEQTPVSKAARVSKARTLAGRSRVRLYSLLGIAAVCALILAKQLVANRHSASAGTPSRIVRLTNDGRSKGDLRAGGTSLYFDESEGRTSRILSLPEGGGPIREIHVGLSNPALDDVSANGRQLLVQSFEGIEEVERLWVVPSSGGDPHLVGDLTCECARWSPDGTRIACTHGTTLVIANSDGTGQRSLASFPLKPTEVVWSPDGKRIRFVLHDGPENNASSAWEIDSDQGSAAQSLHKLPFGEKCCFGWTWTESGAQFAFLKLDADNEPALNVISERNGFPDRTSPRIAFSSHVGRLNGMGSRWDSSSVYLLIDGPPRAELLKPGSSPDIFETAFPGISANYLAFSRDHQRMTYVSTVDQTLWRSRADGTDAVQLTFPPSEAAVSAWSPDGSSIAFMMRLPGRPWRVFFVSANGGEFKEATPVGNDNQGGPSWSADGKMIAFANAECQQTATCRIHLLNISTGKIDEVPGSAGLRTARISPDGRHIAALQPELHQLLVFDLHSKLWKVLADSITGDNVNWSDDSRFIFADSPRAPQAIVERIRVTDGHRVVVANLATLQKMFGYQSNWVGLAPDSKPLIVQYHTDSEIYSLRLMPH